MMRSKLFWGIAFWITWSCVSVEAALSNRQKSVVQQKVVPAYFQDNTQTAYRFLTGMLNRLDEDELTEMDALLAESGAPSVGALLLEARLSQILAGAANKQVRVDPREASLMLPVLHTRVQRLIEEVTGLYAEEFPAYTDLTDYQDVYWQLHVAQNRLRNAARLVQYGSGLLSKALQDKRREPADDPLDQLRLDFDELVARLPQISRELGEVKAELRIRGVARASEVIRNSREFKERLRASYVIGFDGPQVIRFLEEQDATQFTRPLLREENLLDTVRAHVRLANESAGDLAKKSRLLYLGMQWWLRGRYGQGPEGMGLLKSQAALTTPLAQFPLFMPLQPPTPTDPTVTGYSIPKFDRRHHYIWMYEYRRLQVDRSTTTRVERDVDQTTKYTSRTKLSRFY